MKIRYKDKILPFHRNLISERFPQIPVEVGEIFWHTVFFWTRQIQNYLTQYQESLISQVVLHHPIDPKNQLYMTVKSIPGQLNNGLLHTSTTSNHQVIQVTLKGLPLISHPEFFPPGDVAYQDDRMSLSYRQEI